MRYLAALLLIVTACNRAPEVPTSTENGALDDAANMLDSAESNLSSIDEPGIHSDQAD